MIPGKEPPMAAPGAAGEHDDSDAALVDMLMLEAPVGLALFGSDLRFR